MSLADEQKISLNAAAKITPEPVHPSAPWRWMRRGILGRNGQRVFLEGVRVGGKLMTSEPAMERFFAAVAEADAEHFRNDRSGSSTRMKPTESHRKVSVDRAKQEMEDAGF